MLATILLSTMCFGRQYRSPQEVVDPARLERKMARQDIRVANVEKLRAQAEESRAALLAAEKELEHKAARLEHLKLAMAEYHKHQQAMNDILRDIGLENKQEVQEAIKDVKEAQTDVTKTAEEAGVPVPAMDSSTASMMTADSSSTMGEAPSMSPAPSMPAAVEAPAAPVDAAAPTVTAEPAPMAAPVVEEAPTAPIEAVAPTVTAEPAPAAVPAS